MKMASAAMYKVDPHKDCYAWKCIPQFGFLIEVLQCKDEQLEMILLILENDLLATLKIFLTFSVEGATAEADLLANLKIFLTFSVERATAEAHGWQVGGGGGREDSTSC